MQIGVYSLYKGCLASACHPYRYDRYWTFIFFHGGTRGHGLETREDKLTVWEFAGKIGKMTQI